MRIWSIPLSLLAVLQMSFVASAIKVNIAAETIGNKQVEKTQKLKSEKKRDIQLEKAIIKASDGYKEFANQISEDELPVYYYNRIDLNGDKQPEVIVHLIGNFFCGTGGCTTMIFKNVGSEYRLVSEIGISKPPIIVINQKTAGWKNLILLASGGGRQQNETGHYSLRFNGKKYPDVPDNGTKIRRKATITGTELMSDMGSFPGIVLNHNTQ